MKIKLFLFLMTFVLIKYNSFSIWEESNKNLFSSQNIDIVAENNGVYYAGTLGNGIFYSLDNGQTWNKNNDELSKATINSIKFNSQNDVIISTNLGVYISKDNGKTWNFKSKDVYKIDINNNILYGTTLFQGSVLISYNNAETWSVIGNFPNESTINLNIIDDVIYVFFADRRLAISEDNGKTWSIISGNADMIHFKSIHKFDNKIIANTTNGLYVSEDKGYTWPLNPIQFFSGEGSIYIHNNVLYFFSNYDGLFRTTNLFNWQKINSLTYIFNNSLVVKDKLIMAGTGSGLLLSINNGLSFENIINGFTANSVSNIINIDYNIFILTNGKLYHSYNNGDEWNFNKLNDKNDYLKLSGIYRDKILIASEQNIYFSSNLGQTWETIEYDVNINSIYSIAMFEGDKIAIGTHNGIYITENYGISWRKIDDSDVIGRKSKILFYKNKLYVSISGNGLYRTDDNFALKKISDNKILRDISSFSINEDNILVTTNSGLYISNDLGMTWKNKIINDSIFNVFDVFTKSNYFVISTEYGVFYSNEIGENWKELKSNNKNIKVLNMAFNANTLLGTTTTHGIVRTSLLNIGTLDIKNNNYYNPLIFPNPSSDKISLDLSGVAVADLVVYDILGNEIMSIPNYSNKSEIDISTLSIGTYTIQIQTNTGSISQRLLVNR